MKVPGEADGLHGHGGARGFYLFYGGTSKHIAIFPGPGPGCFPKCLKEYIHQHGAPACICTNSASVEISAEILEIYHDCSIRDGQSEPYYKNQTLVKERSKISNECWLTSPKSPTLPMSIGL